MRRILLLLISLIPLQAAVFIPDTLGCSTSHCSPDISGNVDFSPPRGLPGLKLIFHDTQPGGSGASLGVSCGGVSRVCIAVYNTSPYAVAYSNTGSIIWQSTAAPSDAIGCVPMVGADGGAIICDETKIVRYGPTGTQLWGTCYYTGTFPSCNCPGGGATPCSNPRALPNSMTPLPDGKIFIGLWSNGSGLKAPNLVINSDTGALLSTTYLDASGNDSYGTNNTAAAVASTTAGNSKVYINTNWSATATLGRMYGLNVAPDGTVTVDWRSNFNGPSNSSPTIIGTYPTGGVYADGKDSGATGTVWGWNLLDGSVRFHCEVDNGGGSGCPTLSSVIAAAFQPDFTQGGFWTFTPSAAFHGLTRRSTTDGSQLQFIDTSSIVPAEVATSNCVLFPGSAIVAVPDPVSSHTILLTSLHSTTACNGGVYVAAIDTSTGTLRWAYKVFDHFATQGNLPGQFPVVLDPNGKPMVAFTAQLAGGGGVYYIGDFPGLGNFSYGSGTTFGTGTTHP